MFLIRLPPSMREAVGAGTHETAAAVVKAADALWDAQGGHDPTVATALTQRSRSLLLVVGREATKGKVMPAPPHGQTFIRFKILVMTCVNFTIIMRIRLTGVLRPVLGRKTSLPPDHFWFEGQSNTRHCHGNAFPHQCWIDFFHRRIDKLQVFG
jgi:hypothetical protein